MRVTSQSFHHRLQNNILLVCNSVLISALILIAIAGLIAKSYTTLFFASISAILLIISLLLQIFKYYTVSCYLTVITVIVATWGILLKRPVMSADLVYLFVSYQTIPLMLSGLIAKNRSFTLIISTFIISLLTYYIFSIQAPLIGLSHFIQITGAYLCTISIAVLSDQTYMFTGEIIGRYDDSLIDIKNKNRYIKDVITVYNNNQNSGLQLENLQFNTSAISSELSESFQKFTEDIHELHQLLKDSTIRNTNISSNTVNILKVFENHKRHIMDYKNKIDAISTTSQEISDIVQDKKAQMINLTELSTKGNQYMEDSISSVKKVADNSKDMVDMIALIMEVAEKTNILALNAAVEASRAGKYGGGFAIVAKEIKTLSTETTQNADIINQSLQNNISSINQAVNIIQNVGQSFLILNSSIVDFSVAIDQIINKINALTQQNSQISIDTKNTLSLINEVEHILEKLIHNIDQGQQKIAQINSISTVLDNDVTQIQAKTNSIHESGRRMQDQYKEYNYSIQKISDTVEILDQQIQSE